MSLSALPLVQRLRGILYKSIVPLTALAADAWEIAPAEKRQERPTYCLAGQFERIERISEFSHSLEDELARLQGGREVQHAATRGYLIKGALLADGVIYKKSATKYLHARTRTFPSPVVDLQTQRAALYCSYPGNNYFGNWLMDDCLTYALAREHGVPVRTVFPKKSPQMAQYAALLDMHPLMCQSTFFEELVVFDDFGQNSNKQARAVALTQKLQGGPTAQRHAGVFIVRGAGGRKRTLVNEMQVAEHLQAKYGLRIVDPLKLSAAEVVKQCAGSSLVVGVEGSHLIHGVQMQGRGDALLVLQPPRRYCTMFKEVADRNEQRFGVLVGQSTGHEDDFSVSLDEVDASIDLMLSAV